MPRRIHLIVIDPQRSFCEEVIDPTNPANSFAYQQLVHNGELCVPGAWADMNVKLPNLIDRLGRKLDDVSVTMDSHQRLHIAHGRWYRNRQGQSPAPFTLMREESGRIINYSIDAQNVVHDLGEYTTFVPNALPWTLHYLKELVARKRYLHCIWPEHCLIGTTGHNIVPALMEAFLNWGNLVNQTTNFITKGSNPCVEHFSAVQAEVPFDGDKDMGLKSDPSTQINADFITAVMEADEILLSGEAGSHCLANTVFDMADFFGTGVNDFTQKLVLLTDATSAVPGFEGLQAAFVSKMQARGMKLTTTVDYLAV